MCLAASCSSVAGGAANSSLGNTPGNIQNMGLAAEDESFIYYINAASDSCIYKLNKATGEKTRLNEIDSLWLNLSGDWIYFYDIANCFLYRINKDGGGLTNVSSLKRLNENDTDAMWYPIMQGDWLYYSNLHESATRLYKANIDQSDPVPLTSRDAIDINVYGDYIYYSAINDMQKIYRVKKDGTGDRRVMNEKGGYVQIAGDYIYYINIGDADKLYRIKLNRRYKQKLADDVVVYFNLSGDEIFYVSGGDKRYLYKIKTDGTGKQLLAELNCSFINVLSDWVFFLASDDAAAADGENPYTLYRVSRNGGELEAID